MGCITNNDYQYIPTIMRSIVQKRQLFCLWQVDLHLLLPPAIMFVISHHSKIIITYFGLAVCGLRIV